LVFFVCFDLNQKLQPWKKQTKIGEKMVDSELKISCGHMMNEIIGLWFLQISSKID